MILIVRYDQIDRRNGELSQVSHLIKVQRGQNRLIFLCPLERSSNSGISTGSCMSHGKKIVRIIYEVKEKKKCNYIRFNLVGTLRHGTEIHRVTEGTAPRLRRVSLCYLYLRF
jgi:hypothetical protein